MQQAQNLFHATGDQAGKYRQAVDSELQQLMMTWNGAAAGKFGEGMQGWYQSCNAIITKLAEIEQLMGTTINQIMQTGEDTAAAATTFAGQVSVGLPGL
jgi:WXG100 family type VII secretion target